MRGLANNENLRPYDNRSVSEARENGKKGGIASGAARRKKKKLRTRIQDALSTAVTNPKIKSKIEKMGMDPEDATAFDAVVASLLSEAIMCQNVKAIAMLMDYAGESPAEKRAQAEEDRKAQAFKMQMDAVENLERDNDAVLQYIDGLKVKDDTAERETD